jgi:broad specificity phosphatase PhoE
METDIDPRLVDRDYGPWAGEPADDLRSRFGADLPHLPCSESLQAVTDRALAFLDEQAEHGPRGPVVLVTHDVVNRLLLHALDPAVGPAHAIEQQTAGWNAIELTSTGWRVRTINGDAAAMRRASDPE